MARQYFNSSLADSLITASSVTPTTTQTSIFTPFNLGAQVFPVPVGQAAPFVGQVFRFACGGLLTTPATGTMIITPFMGIGASAISFTGAVSLGASAAQTVTASLSNAPWRMEGELIFRSISPVASSSTCWLCGNFSSQGTLATAGSGWNIQFGSAAAVTVDTTGTVAAGSGALIFAVTFSVSGATIITEYTSFQSLN